MCGHLDTVPPGEGWSTDPLDLVEQDGRWCGRGACDMTVFCALAVELLRSASRGTLSRGPLHVLLLGDEELGALGAAALAHAWPADRVLPAACVIGEPGGQLSGSPLEPMVLAVLDRESGCLPGVPMGQLVRARGSVGTLSFFSRAMSRCRLSRLSGGGILPESPTILVAATILFPFRSFGGVRTDGASSTTVRSSFPRTVYLSESALLTTEQTLPLTIARWAPLTRPAGLSSPAGSGLAASRC